MLARAVCTPGPGLLPGRSGELQTLGVGPRMSKSAQEEAHGGTGSAARTGCGLNWCLRSKPARSPELRGPWAKPQPPDCCLCRQTHTWRSATMPGTRSLRARSVTGTRVQPSFPRGTRGLHGGSS